MITRHIDEKTIGIFWLTSSDDPSTVDHFTDLDYLFDGLLVKQRGMNHQIKYNFYVGNNFGKEIYLSLAHLESANIEQFIKKGINIIHTDQDQEIEIRKKIIVLTDTVDSIQPVIRQKLQKKFKSFELCFVS